ncbi:MAG: (d)CMP kinase [Thermoplasmataceae archaeon]
MRVTISGPIGSGKTTVGKILADRMGLGFFSGGQIFRESARQARMSLEQYGKLAENNPDIDRRQDDLQIEVLRNNDNMVFESRLAGWLAGTNDIRAVKVYLDAPRDVRIRRVSGREGSDFQKEMEEMKRREDSEVARYRKYYGIDFRDWQGYDLRIDTSNMTADEVSNRIMEFCNVH